MRSWKTWFGLATTIALSLAFGTQAGCTEHKVGGRTSVEAFADASVAKLADAACEGDAASVKQAIESGVDPNAVGFEGVTPLIWALNCGNPTGLEALLLAGANPNQAAKRGYSAVYLAATMADPVLLKALLNNKGNPNAHNESDTKSALDEALSLGINTGAWNNYYALIDAGADINRENSIGWTIADQAAALGRFDKVFELLDRGYKRNLLGLGRIVQNRVVPKDSPQASWQAKTKERLSSSGIRFPIPPELEE